MAEVLDDCRAQLADVIGRQNRKNAFEKYIKMLIGYSGTCPSQKRQLDELLSEVVNGTLNGGNYCRILSLAYAI